MTKATAEASAAAPRLHPLLFDACRCSQSPGRLCLTCARWHRHYLAVNQRRRNWRAAR